MSHEEASDDAHQRAHQRNAGDQLRLKHFRLLELIDHGGSLSYAARELHLSQPAVTKLLHDLEDVFGSDLVDRGARGGQLTASGQNARARLRIALAHVDLAIRTRSEAIPTVRIGILPLTVTHLLTPALAHLRGKGDVSRLVVHESTARGLLEDLFAGQTDCALGHIDAQYVTRAETDQYVFLPLAASGLVVAASPNHPFAQGKQRITMAQLAGQDWVVAHTGSATRQAFDRAFVDAGLAPVRPMVESMSFHTNLQLVAQTDLLTLAPESAVEPLERQGTIRRIRSALAVHPGGITFVASKPAMEMPALAALYDALAWASAKADKNGRAATGT